MLNNLLEGWFKYPVGDGAFYAVFGFIFVFLGITLLILIFTALGAIMKKVNAMPPRQKKKRRKKQQMEQNTAADVPERESEADISPEVVAAITAAIATCLQGEQSKCDFIVKRIRKL